MFTKGEWRIARGRRSVAIGEGSRIRIDAGPAGMGKEEVESNARLIAAAPKLYAIVAQFAIEVEGDCRESVLENLSSEALDTLETVSATMKEIILAGTKHGAPEVI